MEIKTSTKFVAELVGTFGLVLFGCGPAVLAGGEPLSHLWLFIVAPIVGAVVAAGVWKFLEPKGE